MKKFAALTLLFTLAACQTPEQIAEQKRMQEENDIQTCMSYGLRPKSEAFGNCRLQLDLARQQRYYNDYNYGYGYGYGHRFGSSIYFVR